MSEPEEDVEAAMRAFTIVALNLTGEQYTDELNAAASPDDIEKLRAAIRAALAAARPFMAGEGVEAWRDMGSAPKGGSHGHVLIALDNGRVCEGWWGVTTYDRKRKAYNLGWVNHPGNAVKAIGWRPLPAHPAESALAAPLPDTGMGEVASLVERLTGTPDRMTAIDRLRLYATDDETWHFDFDDAAEVVELLDDLLAALTRRT